MPKPDLDSAYALKSPEDAKRFYDAWAGTYQSEFAKKMDYRLHRRVAEAFVRRNGTGPVLDFGCGTGLVGDVLAEFGAGPIDGCDLSPEMLAVARKKGVYRTLIEGDVLGDPGLAAAPYAGVVSAGTFTHGHVGPQGLLPLIRLAAPGAQFAVSINAEFFEAANFAKAFRALGDRIEALELPRVRIYGPGAEGEHARAESVIATFRTA